MKKVFIQIIWNQFLKTIDKVLNHQSLLANAVPKCSFESFIRWSHKLHILKSISSGLFFVVLKYTLQTPVLSKVASRKRCSKSDQRFSLGFLVSGKRWRLQCKRQLLNRTVRKARVLFSRTYRSVPSGSTKNDSA